MIFGESAGVDPKPAEVRSISTSDPLLFVGYDVTTILMLRASVTWLLNTFRQILEIKKLRSTTENLGFTEKELKIFDDRIASAVDKSIEARIAQILDDKKPTPRRNELRNGLDWALRSLMARIERGLTVEIQFLRPPSDAPEPKTDVFDQLSNVAKELEFPQIAGTPLVQIPGPPPDEAGGDDGKSTDPTETGTQKKARSRPREKSE